MTLRGSRAIGLSLVVLFQSSTSHGDMSSLAGLSSSLSIPSSGFTSECSQYNAVPDQICGSTQSSGTTYHPDCSMEAIRRDNPTAHLHGLEYLHELRAYCSTQKYKAEEETCRQTVSSQVGNLVSECEWEAVMDKANQQSIQTMQSMMQLAMACSQGKKMPCAMAAMAKAMEMAAQAKSIADEFMASERRKQVQAQLEALNEQFNGDDDEDTGPPAPPPIQEGGEQPTEYQRPRNEDLSRIIHEIVGTSASTESTDGTSDSGESSSGGPGGGSTSASQEDSGKELSEDALKPIMDTLAKNPEGLSQALADGSLTPDMISQGQVPSDLMNSGPGGGDAGLVAGGERRGDALAEDASDGSSLAALTGAAKAAGKFAGTKGSEKITMPGSRNLDRDIASLGDGSKLPPGVIPQSAGGLGFLMGRISIHTGAHVRRLSHHQR